ncbi:hypothetical protein FBY03_101280 [Pseudomonas sp. SJZ079]|uniref:hypothetical protein n=1 Tax=Pseudomonas sp. SJZ079 TaxID=2572887 RepID=UPI00119A978A|nr:hypothetical protein [Pseudomonas sp. SJZ079]TWC43087.1 hypothetical protein FBY03_101280 [Pseudomonas sp. SJZ079]
MGLEDRERWRDERRQLGRKASWDYFGAGQPRPQAEDAGKISSVEDMDRVERPTKQRTPPSYLHLQAQETLGARSKGSGAYFWLAIVCVAVILNGLAYLYLTH